MRRSLSLLCLFLFLFIPAKAFALSAPITSPYGWRTHPIYGTQRYHSGVDLGVDEGTALTAILPGTVESAGWLGGYGYAVIIDHGNGMETLFGHCSQLFAVPGQAVAAGTLVAASGNTGDSTGPHVHVELRVNGSPTDPMSLLLQVGWDITGEAAPSEYYVNSDYDEMLWNFGDFVDIARQLREIVNEFADHFAKGLGYLQDDVVGYLNMLMVIDLALTLLFSGILADQAEIFDLMVRKLMQYGLVAALANNWKDFINNFILSFFTDFATKLAGGGDTIAQNMSDPSLLVQKGVGLVQPVFAYLSTFSGAHMVANLHNVFIAMIIGLGMLLCFAIIGIAIALTYLEFYMTCIVAFVTVPMAALKCTQFIGDKSLSGVINAGIKLMTMTFAVAIVVSYIKDYTAPVYDIIPYFRILVFCVVLTVFVCYVPNRISNLLNVSFRFPTFWR